MSWQTLVTFAAQAAQAGAPAVGDFTTFDSPKFAKTLEVALDSITINGGATVVTLGVWRLTETKIDRMGRFTLRSTDIKPNPVFLDFQGDAACVRVESFVGGAGPTLNAIVRVRNATLLGGAPQESMEDLSGMAGDVATLVGDVESVIGAPDVAVPTKVVLNGGVGKDTAPGAVTDARTTRAWYSRVGVASSFLATMAGAALKTALAVPSAVADILNTIPMSLYSLAPTVRVDGQVGPAQQNALGAQHSDATTKTAGEDLGNDVLTVHRKFPASSGVAAPPGGGVYYPKISKSAAKEAARVAVGTGGTDAAGACVFYGAIISLDPTLPPGDYVVHVQNAIAVPVAGGAVTTLIAPVWVHWNGGVAGEPIALDFPAGIQASTGLIVSVSADVDPTKYTAIGALALITVEYTV